MSKTDGTSLGIRRWLRGVPAFTVVRLGTVVLLAGFAVALVGGALGAAAWFRPMPAPAVVLPPAPTGAEGAGALYVSAWLRAGGSNDATDVAAFWLPALDLRQTSPVDVGLVVPVESHMIACDPPHPDCRDYWAVTVGAEVGGWVRWFGVSMLQEAGGWVATTLPAEIAGPRRLSSARTLYGSLEPPRLNDPVVATIRGALTVMLTGESIDNRLDRWLAPDSDVRPVVPPPYREIAVTGIAKRTVGDELAALVEIDADGRLLHYTLRLSQREGRWELVSIQGGPALADDRPTPVRRPVPVTSTSTTSTTRPRL